MKPPLNHMMINEDTLADEFDAILNYRVSHAGIVLPGGYTEAQVYAGAGITSGVTPGVDAAVTPGHITALGSMGALSGGSNDSVLITHQYATDGANSAEAAQTAYGDGATGTGTEADPYIVTKQFVYAFTAANGDTTPAFTWDHDAATYPSEVYWIKWVDCAFGVNAFNGNLAGDLRVDAPTGGGAILQFCTFECSQNFNEGAFTGAHIKAVRGTTRIDSCKIIRSTGAFVKKTGADAIVEVTDTLLDNSGGSWANSVSHFWNTVTGGSFALTRITHDVATSNAFVQAAADIAVTIDALDFNSSDNANIQSFLSTKNTVLLEPWTSGFTMTDSRIRSGALSVVLLGWGTASDNQKIANWTITNCEFIASDTISNATTLTADANDTDTTLTVASSTGYTFLNAIRIKLDAAGYYYGTVTSAPTGTSILLSHPFVGTATSGNAVEEMRMGGAELIKLGDGDTTASDSCDNVTFSWCRFQRPLGGIKAGCEVFNLFRARNTTIQYCWIDQCGEDGYEFQSPVQNCKVIYSGGNLVAGNMVDFFGGFTGSGANYAWSAASSPANLGGHMAHHIWGDCGSDAVSVDCVHGVTVHHIDIDNVAGGFQQNPPAANVRLQWRSTGTTPSLNGVTVLAPLSAEGISFNGEPCLLCYEVAGAETYADTVTATSTLRWVNGKDATIRECDDATAIVDAG